MFSDATAGHRAPTCPPHTPTVPALAVVRVANQRPWPAAPQNYSAAQPVCLHPLPSRPVITGRLRPAGRQPFGRCTLATNSFRMRSLPYHSCAMISWARRRCWHFLDVALGPHPAPQTINQNKRALGARGKACCFGIFGNLRLTVYPNVC